MTWHNGRTELSGIYPGEVTQASSIETLIISNIHGYCDGLESIFASLLSSLNIAFGTLNLLGISCQLPNTPS